MKKIKITFHKIHKYTDSTGEVRTEMEFSFSKGELNCRMSIDCGGLFTVTSFSGPYEPTRVLEIENSLKDEESKGVISNLVFENEVTLEGVEMEITSDQIQMN